MVMPFASTLRQLAAIVVTAVLILELIGPVAVQFALRRAASVTVTWVSTMCGEQVT